MEIDRCCLLLSFDQQVFYGETHRAFRIRDADNPRERKGFRASP